MNAWNKKEVGKLGRHEGGSVSQSRLWYMPGIVLGTLGQLRLPALLDPAFRSFSGAGGCPGQ